MIYSFNLNSISCIFLLQFFNSLLLILSIFLLISLILMIFFILSSKTKSIRLCNCESSSFFTFCSTALLMTSIVCFPIVLLWFSSLLLNSFIIVKICSISFSHFWVLAPVSLVCLSILCKYIVIAFLFCSWYNLISFETIKSDCSRTFFSMFWKVAVISSSKAIPSSIQITLNLLILDSKSIMCVL